MTKIQTITSPSGDRLVVLPIAVYEELVDAATAREVRAALDEGREELLTGAEVDALLASATPLAFWRRKRGMSAAEIDESLGLAQGHVSELETGSRDGTDETYRALAGLLGITPEDLAPRTAVRAQRTGAGVARQSAAGHRSRLR